jgi:hypothetical protein
MAYLMILAGLSGCGIYSFSGASVPTDIRTLHIAQMRNNALLVNPALSQQLSDAFRDKCLAESNLKLGAPGVTDWEFTGEIQDYSVTAAAVSGQEKTSLNRLTVVWKLQFRVKGKEKQGWEQRFTRYADFDAGLPLQSVEGELVNQIIRQLVDDAFNKVFIQW